MLNAQKDNAMLVGIGPKSEGNSTDSSLLSGSKKNQRRLFFYP
jgi:hypothetical protein